MVSAFFTNIQTDAANFYGWWVSIDGVYRGGGCLLAGLYLMWDATKSAGERDRKFFLTGMFALVLLGYGATQLVQR
jgi:hypothetical protein